MSGSLKRIHLDNKMQLQHQGLGMCVPTAFAMVANIDVKEMLIGFTKDSFHPQEMARLLYVYGYYFIEFTEDLIVEHDNGRKVQCRGLSPILGMQEGDGVIIITTSEIRHAVAWNSKQCKIYDPNGTIYHLGGSFNIESFWLALK